MSTDVLRWPVIGTALRWKHARTAVQLLLLLVAAAIVVHGLLGRQFAPGNLATVLTWIHYRGLLVITLLAAGNFFCMGCPMVRVRDWGRRLHRPSRSWPRVLRSKWTGVALFALVLFSYELFDLWSLPGATAWLVLAYFAAALTIDLVFKGAAFCKYVCPVGQFNFVASTVSPLELQVRSNDVCRSCRTFDCIKGNRVTSQRGCELGLFLPAKVGNLDCTFCLDCVQACPHDNIALGSRVPAAELLETRRRSGIGKLTDRPDLAALAALFTFGALVNAFAMTPGAQGMQGWLTGRTGMTGLGALAAVFLLGLAILPVALFAGASAFTRVISGEDQTLTSIATRYAYALVPLGMAIWFAHYSFHFLTGFAAVAPAIDGAARDLFEWPLFDHAGHLTGIQPGAVVPLEIGSILLGALGSAALAYGVSERDYRGRAVAASIPWLLVVLAIASAALWTVVQPMEMRGMAHESMAWIRPSIGLSGAGWR